MSIDYKKELEAAAKSMILVYDPKTLIRMIVRTIVQKANVTHAGILLHDRAANNYVLTVSRGQKGKKIPAGFARMDSDNPLIRFFLQRLDNKIFGDGMLTKTEAEKAVNTGEIEKNEKLIIEETLDQMDIFGITACIPSYFKDDLLGVLLLGSKNNSEEFKKDELGFFSALASDVAMALRNAQLISDLQVELGRRQELFIQMISALGASIEAKDYYTRGHTERVTKISLKIAQSLLEKTTSIFDNEFLEHLQIASLLHDIGKIGIPENILNKNGVLAPEERKIIMNHSKIGASILQHIKQLKEPILGVKHHHERYDGTGYPDGLKGSEIPLIASIIAGADAFDAMTTDRPYRHALSKKEAVEEIKKESGKQFNPQIAETIIELFNSNKI